MSDCLMRILVVDDDATARVLMRAALTRAGFEVLLAAGGGDALRQFGQHGCDLVMLDVNMPDMNGLDVCATLRARAGELLPIVIVTGMDDVQSVEMAYGAGATDFIAKPFNWALIGHRVRYFLRAARALAELRSAHARNAAILDAIPDTLFRLDESGLVLEVRARGGAAALALPLFGRPLSDSFPVAVAQRLMARVYRAFESGMVQDTGFSLPGQDGARRHYEARITMIDQAEALCLMRDITARKRAEAELVRSQDKLQQAQAVAHLGSWYANLETGALEWSAQTYRMFDVPEGTAVSRDFVFSLVDPQDLAAARQAWERALAGQPYTVEYRVGGAGRVAWLLETAEVEFARGDRVRGVVGTVQDITERKETENRIASLAYLDSLTGLPNRASFLARLGREVARAQIEGTLLGVLFMDLDGFKSINDTLGHHTGDQILQAVADRLRDVMRRSDMVSRPAGGADGADLRLARLGGDEFTALMPALGTIGHARAAAQRINEQMRRPFLVGGRDLRLSASIGIAVYPGDGEDVATLLKHADTAMYHAKELGRDNCQFYSAALTQRAVQRMNMERDLRVALEERQFHLAYQPQFDVGSGRIASVEALIRWEHPVRGLVPPLDFIALAESNGLIVMIGKYVLQLACADAARWQRAGLRLRVAVNLSPLQLKDPGLLRTVLDMLEQTGLAPELLELEVTEGALMEDSATTLATLHALRAAGIELSLDDFGTGYSSMSYLKRMPLTSLKVDQSFVAGLPGDRENESIIRAIVSMAKSLGFMITAEGVETLEQARLLVQLDCDILQGYYISRPVLAADIPGWMAMIGARAWTLAEFGALAHAGAGAPPP